MSSLADDLLDELLWVEDIVGQPQRRGYLDASIWLRELASRMRMVGYFDDALKIDVMAQLMETECLKEAE